MSDLDAYPGQPRSAVAPRSAEAADENAIADELVQVLHTWIADIAPLEGKDAR